MDNNDAIEEKEVDTFLIKLELKERKGLKYSYTNRAAIKKHAHFKTKKGDRTGVNLKPGKVS